MLKKLIILLAVFSIYSCKNNAVDSASESVVTDSDFIIDDKSNDELSEKPSDILPEGEKFEVVADEKAAEEVNKKTEEAIEEVEVKDRVFFAYDSNDLSDEAKKILDVQTSWLKSDSTINLVIEGHCDEKGTREYNIALGERRALATKNYLVANGVSDSRLKIVSYGKERPAFIGTSEEILAKNRRAVAVIDK